MAKNYMERGDSGEHIRELQKALSDLGFDPQGIDGMFGSGCEQAVRRFQKHYGLSTDGFAGPQTQKKLTELTGKTFKPGVSSEKSTRGLHDASDARAGTLKGTGKPGVVKDGYIFDGEYTIDEIDEALKKLYEKAPYYIKNRNANNGQRIKSAMDFLELHYVTDYKRG